MTKSAILGLAAAMCLSGCGSSSAERASTETTPAMAMGAESCPMQVAGTSVMPADIADGATLSFTSTGDAAELRRRVERMAEMHNHHHSGAGGMMGDDAMMPPSTASVDEIENGARLVLRPVDPAQTALIQAHVRTCADRMSHGECPMISHGDASEGGAAPKG